jgi:hypothetical protein
MLFSLWSVPVVQYELNHVFINRVISTHCNRTQCSSYQLFVNWLAKLVLLCVLLFHKVLVQSKFKRTCYCYSFCYCPYLLTQSPPVARKEGETDPDCQSVARLFVYLALSFACIYDHQSLSNNLRRHQQMYNSLKHMSYFPLPFSSQHHMYFNTWSCALFWDLPKEETY